MNKIPYKEFIKSITMFFINNDVDRKYLEKRAEKLSALKQQMHNINTLDGLKAYIRNYEDSLGNLLVILGVSTELFKRVISMFRIQRQMDFKTEWDVKHTRVFMLSDEEMMNKVCTLFVEGPCNSELSTNIPSYRLRNFVISDTVMKRLQNDDFLDFLISKDFDTQYNSDVSLANIKQVENLLEKICNQECYRLVRKPKVDPVGNGTREIQVNYAIQNEATDEIVCYVKYSFNITTSRGQSDFKRSVKDLRDYIRSTYQNTKQIVIVDGAGWIGRQSDLKDIWDYTDYCLNLNSLNHLNDIII